CDDLILGSRLYSVLPYFLWRAICSSHLARKNSRLGQIFSGPILAIRVLCRLLSPVISRDSIRLVTTVMSATAWAIQSSTVLTLWPMFRLVSHKKVMNCSSACCCC